MSHSRTREHSRSRETRPKRKMRLLLRQKKLDADELATSADLAVNAMARGIRDEVELEEIVHKARPHLRDRVRERLIPHLSFPVRSRIERV